MSERLASIIDLYNTNEDIEANRIRDMLTLDERTVILKDKNLINSFNEKVYGNLFTIKEADEILVLSKNGISERGTHEELLNKQGYYAELYNTQFKNL